MQGDSDAAPGDAPAPFRTLLRERRLAAGLTQEALAERAGLSARAVQNLERGDRRPYPETAARLAAALDLTGAQRETFVAAGHSRPRRGGTNQLTYLFPQGAGAGEPAPAPAPEDNNLPAQLTACIGREAELAEPALVGWGQLAWLSQLEAEHANLREALRWALARPDGGTAALRLAGALARFWGARGHRAEGLGWLEAALAHGHEAGAPAQGRTNVGRRSGREWFRPGA